MAICKCGNEDKDLPASWDNWECWQCVFERFGRLSVDQQIMFKREIDSYVVKTEMDRALQIQDGINDESHQENC